MNNLRQLEACAARWTCNIFSLNLNASSTPPEVKSWVF
jgi:hypothetical protein